MQEAKAASSLDHPNICTIHDIGHTEDDRLFIAMACYDGETLKKRIARGPLPILEALDLTIQTTDGLVKAHGADIVHRDIKPANLMLTTDGLVKVMDFGLAKLAGEPRLTAVGTTLGTASYMSPEQVRGEDADARSDIWSVGVTLYEMVAGQVPFQGERVAVMQAIQMQNPPPLTALRSGVPLSLDRIVERAMAKRAEDRYQTVGDLRSELQRLHREMETADDTPTMTMPGAVVAQIPAVTDPAVTPSISPPPSPEKRRWPVVTVAAVLAVILVAVSVWLWPRDRGSAIPRPGNMKQITRDPGPELDPVLSPDGKMIAFAAGPLDRMDIFVRQITGGRSIRLTEGFSGNHRLPRWSPDGTRIAFRSGPGRDVGDIYVVSALGGIPRRLITPPSGKSVGYHAWSPDGKQLAYVQLDPEGNDEIYIRSVDEDTPRKIAEDLYAHTPCWSPDGTRIAFVSGNPRFVSYGNIAPSTLKVVSVAGGDPVRVTEDGAMNQSPVWTQDSRYLLYVSDRDGGRDIYRIPIDVSGTASGPPERLTTGLNAHTISLTDDGTRLAYSVFTYTSNLWSVQIPDNGPISSAEARLITSGNQLIETCGVSPDGRWIAFDSNRSGSGNQDIYRMPVEGGEPERLTTHPDDDFGPVWSPDGKEIAFMSWRTGNRDIFVMSADGGSVRRLTNRPGSDFFPDWSPDGEDLVFWSTRNERDELYVMSGDLGEIKGETPRLLTEGQFPRWSPDGRLIAYIYNWGDGELRVIPPDGGTPRVLVQEGLQNVPVPQFAAWSSDSRTLYYKAIDSDGVVSFRSVPVSGGESKLLVRFDDPSRQFSRWEFSTDGTRFFFPLTEYESDIWVMELEGR